MTQTRSNIFLVGPMGAGKTTIGRQLARQLKMDFVDSDRAIEEHTGADIPLIFEKEGEEGFRRRERAMIDELTARPNTVLATGGGAILDEQNREYLRSRGDVVYLSSDLATLVERTAKDRSRPLLQAEEPAEVILERLLAQRDPLYRDTAHVIIDTSRDSIRNVIKAIISGLRAKSPAG